MGFRLSTEAIRYNHGEVDTWLQWAYDPLGAKWSQQLVYSVPGKMPTSESHVKTFPTKTLIPTEHQDKSLDELVKIFPPPPFTSSLDD